MSGVTEILLVIAIVLAIFFLPRLAGKKNVEKGYGHEQTLAVSGKMRIAILVSILWPAAIALILKPWDRALIQFLYLGIAPVVFFWGVGWVIVGYRKDKH